MPIGTATAEPQAAPPPPHGRPRVAQGQATETGSTANLPAPGEPARALQGLVLWWSYSRASLTHLPSSFAISSARAARARRLRASSAPPPPPPRRLPTASDPARRSTPTESRSPFPR